VGASNETVAVPAKPTQDAHKPSTIRCPAAAATLPTDIPGFAQLSGCLRAIEGLSSAQKAARQALAVATAAAIARVMERAGCKASQIEVSCASTTSGVGAPEAAAAPAVAASLHRLVHQSTLRGALKGLIIARRKEPRHSRRKSHSAVIPVRSIAAFFCRMWESFRIRALGCAQAKLHHGFPRD